MPTSKSQREPARGFKPSPEEYMLPVGHNRIYECDPRPMPFCQFDASEPRYVFIAITAFRVPVRRRSDIRRVLMGWV